MTLQRAQFWIYVGIWLAVMIIAYAMDGSIFLESLIALGIAFLLARRTEREPLISTKLQDLEVEIHEVRGVLKHVTKFANQETARADRNWEAFCACRDKFVGNPDKPRQGREL